jgi:hypothetical protein
MVSVTCETIKTWISAGLYVKIYKKNGVYMVHVGGPK